MFCNVRLVDDDQGRHVFELESNCTYLLPDSSGKYMRVSPPPGLVLTENHVILSEVNQHRSVLNFLGEFFRFGAARIEGKAGAIPVAVPSEFSI